MSGDEAAAAGDAAAPGAKGDSFVGSLEEAVLHNANQFHKWHTELEAACASETEEKYQQYAQLLHNHLASCDRLQDQVGSCVGWAVGRRLLWWHTKQARTAAQHRAAHPPMPVGCCLSPAIPASLPVYARPCSTYHKSSPGLAWPGLPRLPVQVSKTLGVFDSLLSLHTHVSSSSAAMSSHTEALLAQKATLSEFAEALRARLKFFDEYELAASQFASAAAAPDSTDLMPLLHKLDECISYVAANPQYADAVTYANKFRQLQLKALGLVRGRVQSVLRAAAQTVQAAVAEAAGGAAAAAAAAGAAPAAGAAAAAAGARLSGRANSGALAGGRVPLLPEGQEVSLLYVRFRAAAEPALKGGFRFS